MSVHVTLDVPADAFVLGEAIHQNPDLRIRLERVVPLESTFIPYFWAANGHVETIRTALLREDTIESVETLDTGEAETLIRAEWADEVDGFLDVIHNSNGMILDGNANDGTWSFTLRFPTHEDISTFYRECRDRDIRIDIRTVHNPGIPAGLGLDYDLTERQQEALRTALETGFYDVPREINLTDLADELGISDTAASQRIRRGTATLLEATLADEADDTTVPAEDE